MKKNDNKKGNRLVGCPACFASLRYRDEQDPEEVILNHRVTADCIFAYPFFPEEWKAKKALPKEVKKKFGKNKNKKKKISK